MKLHPQIKAGLKALAEANLPALHTLSPADARAQMDAMVRARGGEAAAVGRTEDRTVPGPAGEIPVRVYWPKADRPLGALLYFHGGGHVIGSIDTHDRVARNLTAGADVVTVSVDYRMGPEHKFPAAVEDSWAALDWLAANTATLGVETGRIAVAGDSAGANLAAVVALMARDAGSPPLCLQALVYPVADYGLVGDSYKRFDEGYGVLTGKAMTWFRDHYLNDPSEAGDWRASPALAPSLAGVAPAIVVAAECDVLHDDGVRYADALKAAGVPAEHVEYAGMIHGFFGMAPDVDAAVTAQARVVEAIRLAMTPAGAGG